MIKLDNVSISYEDKKIISSLSFCFNKGFNAILGPSGIGKTTIIKAIMGLIEYEGKIQSESNKFAAVFEENRLCEDFTVYKNLKMVCKDKSRIQEAVIHIGLRDSIHSRVCSLSGGMKRRVSILRALLSDYDILILDEPFTGLDSDNKSIVMNYIKEKTSEKTVILITHNYSEVEFYDCNILHLNL